MNKALGTSLQPYLWIPEKMDSQLNPLLSEITFFFISLSHFTPRYDLMLSIYNQVSTFTLRILVYDYIEITTPSSMVIIIIMFRILIF